jgi:hypothetical protein
MSIRGRSDDELTRSDPAAVEDGPDPGEQVVLGGVRDPVVERSGDVQAAATALRDRCGAVEIAVSSGAGRAAAEVPGRMVTDEAGDGRRGGRETPGAGTRFQDEGTAVRGGRPRGFPAAATAAQSTKKAMLE